MARIYRSPEQMNRSIPPHGNAFRLNKGVVHDVYIDIYEYIYRIDLYKRTPDQQTDTYTRAVPLAYTHPAAASRPSLHPGRKARPTTFRRAPMQLRLPPDTLLPESEYSESHTAIRILSASDSR